MFGMIASRGGRRVQPPTAERLGQVGGINTRTASYTAKLSDAAGVIEMNSGSANNLTIPPQSSVPWKKFAWLNWCQIGAGRTTIVAGSGVTIRSRNGLLSGGQYGGGTLYRRGKDEWVLFGDVASS